MWYINSSRTFFSGKESEMPMLNRGINEFYRVFQLLSDQVWSYVWLVIRGPHYLQDCVENTLIQRSEYTTLFLRFPTGIVLLYRTIKCYVLGRNILSSVAEPGCGVFYYQIYVLRWTYLTHYLKRCCTVSVMTHDFNIILIWFEIIDHSQLLFLSNKSKNHLK